MGKIIEIAKRAKRRIDRAAMASTHRLAKTMVESTVGQSVLAMDIQAHPGLVVCQCVPPLEPGVPRCKVCGRMSEGEALAEMEALNETVCWRCSKCSYVTTDYAAAVRHPASCDRRMIPGRRLIGTLGKLVTPRAVGAPVFTGEKKMQLVKGKGKGKGKGGGNNNGQT